MIGMDSSLPHGKCITDAFRETITLLGAAELSAELASGAGTIGGVAGVITISGDVNWQVLIALPRDLAGHFCDAFAGFHVTYDGPELVDAVGEMTNIFGGILARHLEAEGLNTSRTIPSAIQTPILATLLPDEDVAFVTDFVLPIGSIRLSVVVNSAASRPLEEGKVGAVAQTVVTVVENSPAPPHGSTA